MNPLIQFFNIVLYQPLLNLLILFYLYIPGHDFGIAVIALTLVMKLVLFPSSRKSIISQKALAKIQPKIKEIQNKFKDDRQQQSVELMKLYKQEKVSPMSGCLPILLQLPVLIALYRVFLNGLTPESLENSLYGFVHLTGAIKTTFLGVVDLFKPFMTTVDEKTVYYWPVLVLALIAAAIQFIQSKKTMPARNASPSDAGGPAAKSGKPDFSQSMQKQMIYFLPLLTIFIIVKFGSIIGLYWITSSLFAILEHHFIAKKAKKSIVES